MSSTYEIARCSGSEPIMILPPTKNVCLPCHNSNRFFGLISTFLLALIDSDLRCCRCAVSIFPGRPGLSLVWLLLPLLLRCCSVGPATPRPLWYLSSPSLPSPPTPLVAPPLPPPALRPHTPTPPP